MEKVLPGMSLKGRAEVACSGHGLRADAGKKPAPPGWQKVSRLAGESARMPTVSSNKVRNMLGLRRSSRGIKKPRQWLTGAFEI